MRRAIPSFALILSLALLLLPPQRAAAGERAGRSSTLAALQPAQLLALSELPDFLATPAPEKRPEKEEPEAITPFLGTDGVLTTLPTPERPAIAVKDEVARERTEVTAGIHIDLGSFKLNLGYTLPASQVDSFVHPLGVNLDPGTDTKRFSLGVKIPF